MALDPVFDFAVVGAGMAGASVAYRLGLQGASVAVLEQEAQPGYHTTGRSAAIFIETYGTPQIRAMTRASRDFYLSPPEGFAAHPILSPRGVLYIAEPGQEDRLEAEQREFERQGLDCEALNAQQAVAMVPCLLPGKLSGALLDPVASDMDVHTLHQGFLRGMARHGAVLQCKSQLRGARREQAAWRLQVSGGETLCARTLVNAAGAWADPVAQLCGVAPIGIQPMRRAAFIFPAPDEYDSAGWPVVSDIAETFYFKPDAGAMLGSPANADPVSPHDVVPEELDIATGIYRIESSTTLRIRRPTHTWAGLRSFAPDHEFVIGWEEGVPGYFWLAGQGGYGIQTAAGASELAAALLLGQPLPESLTRFGVTAEAVSPRRLR